MAASSWARIFSLRALRKEWELIPITAIMGVAVSGASAFMVYSMFHKPDVWVLNRSDGTPPWEKKNKANPCNMKEFLIGRRHVTMPEIEALRKEIGSMKTN